MTNKQLLFGTTVIGLSLAIASTGIVSASGGFHKKVGAQNRQIVQEAVVDKDYQAWVQALEGHKNVPFELSEKTFNAFVNAHDALQDGDREKAGEFLESAGIELPKQGPRSVNLGMAHGKGYGKHGPNEAVRNAIETNNYSAWLEAIADKPMAEIANEDIFAKMVAIHEARESGDKETAKQLHHELRELIKDLRFR